MRKMKDSGIPFIGYIPKNWKLQKVKNNYSIRGEKNQPEKEVLSVYRELGVVRKSDRDDNHNVTSEDTSNYKYVLPTDLVVNKMKAWQGSMGISQHEGIVSPAYYVFRQISDIIYPFYMHYLLRNQAYLPEYRRLSGGIRIGQWDLSVDNFKNIPVVIPPLEEQYRIANYLDEKCAKIDAIIEKQQAVIKKLKAYKLSVVNEVVADVVGIPCHLGYIGIMKNGLNFNTVSEGNAVKFLGVGDFKDYFVLNNQDMFSEIILEEAVPDDYLLHDGDFVFVRSNGSKELVGRCIMVKNVDFPLTYSGFCIRFRNIRSDILDNKFLLYYFRSPYFRKQLEKYSQGSNISNINQDLLSRITITIPEMDVQLEAVERLEQLNTRIDKILERKQSVIDKLTEYKKSLIYEVVTGKEEV